MFYFQQHFLFRPFFFFFLLILQCRSFRRVFSPQEFEYVYLRNAPSAILIGLFMCPRALQSPRSGEFKYQRSVLEGNFCLTFQFWVETYLLTLTFKKGTNVNTREKGKSKMVGGRKREESLHMLQENWTRFRNRWSGILKVCKAFSCRILLGMNWNVTDEVRFRYTVTGLRL